MLVIVNPYSGGERADLKWERINKYFFSNTEIFYSNGKNNLNEIIARSLARGNKHFVAAGGDGTVNILLNKLINLATSNQLKEISLGAVGIGSSNDFHKPFHKDMQIDGIPVKINFAEAELRDAALISYKENNYEIKKYFLINASAGLTADANYFFNNPDYLLRQLKRISTGFAILYCIVKTIVSYKNFQVNITSPGKADISCFMTNIGITKNPWFSGNLFYGGNPVYNNGKFDIHLFSNMNKKNIMELFFALTRGNINRVKKGVSWSTDEITISSEKDFNFEYDGEIIKTDKVTIRILPELLKVCK